MSNKNKRANFFSGIILFLIGLTLIVSCQGSDVTPTKQSPSPKATTEMDVAKVINLGTSLWPGYTPWQVAQEVGIFEKNNIKVNLQVYDYFESIKVLSAGKIDGNSQTLGDVITVAGKQGKEDNVIVCYLDYSNGGDAIVADQKIKKIADLKNKKIGVEIGSLDYFLLLSGLEKAGIKTTDVEIQSLDLSASVAAFITKKVDAVALFHPFINQALRRPGSKILFSSKDFPGLVQDHLVVTRKLIEERPEDVQGLINSWYETQDYITRHPEETAQIMATAMGISLEEFISTRKDLKFLTDEESLKAFKGVTAPTDLLPAAEKITKFLLAEKVIKKSPNLRKLFDYQFVERYVFSKKKL